MADLETVVNLQQRAIEDLTAKLECLEALIKAYVAQLPASELARVRRLADSHEAFIRRLKTTSQIAWPDLHFHE